MKTIRIFYLKTFLFLVVKVPIYLNSRVFVMGQNLLMKSKELDLAPRLYHFSCSTQLSTKFSLLINMKIPTIVGIFIFISREMFMLRHV